MWRVMLMSTNEREGLAWLYDDTTQAEYPNGFAGSSDDFCVSLAQAELLCDAFNIRDYGRCA